MKFFGTSEGYFDFVNNRYIYHYNDHLGNVRLSFARESNTAVIVEQNDYYAFGLKHNGPVFNPTGLDYKYQYNGKEMQDEIGMLDYGARFYMPDLGRWGVVDPLAEISRRFSPYVYGNNNPMRYIDPDGRSSETYTGQDAQDAYWHFYFGGSVSNFSGTHSSSNATQASYNYIDAGGSGGGGGGSSLSSWMQSYVGNSFGPGDPVRQYLQQTTNSYFGAIESVDQYQLDHANWIDEYQGTMEFLGKLKEYFDSVGDKMGGAGYGTFAIDNLKTIKETVEKFKNFNPSLASVAGAITGVIGTSVNMEGDRFSQLMDIYKNADYRYDQLHKRNPMLDKGVTINVNVVIGTNGGGGYTDIKIYDISTHRYLSGGKIIHRNYK